MEKKSTDKLLDFDTESLKNHSRWPILNEEIVCICATIEIVLDLYMKILIRWQILNEEIDCTEEEMMLFAALQLQVVN